MSEETQVPTQKPSLKERHRVLKAEFKALTAKYDRILNLYVDRGIELDEVVVHFKRLQAEFAALERKNQLSVVRRKALKAQIEELLGQLSRLRQEADKERPVSEQLQRSNAELAAAKVRLESDNSTLTHQNAELALENQSMKNSLETLRSMAGDRKIKDAINQILSGEGILNVEY